MVAATPLDILRFLDARSAEGLDCALVTLVGIEGGSSRAVGAQMAVAADGRRIGSFSGGCVEDAVAAEALETLRDGWGHVVRYGIGSPFIDIRLPCGGGIDLLFTPRPAPSTIGKVLVLLGQRQSATLRIDCDGIELVYAGSEKRWDGQDVTVTYQPPLHVIALGQGEDLTALCLLAKAFGTSVTALSPDGGTQALLGQSGIEAIPLLSRNALPPFATDPWTAILFLFHGRDWEEFLLPQALAKPAFYHGAIGSRRTHAARLEALRAAGVDDSTVGQLRGHIGLIPATRDPGTLALSILGEIVAEYNALAAFTYWTGQPLTLASLR